MFTILSPRLFSNAVFHPSGSVPSSYRTLCLPFSFSASSPRFCLHAAAKTSAPPSGALLNSCQRGFSDLTPALSNSRHHRFLSVEPYLQGFRIIHQTPLGSLNMAICFQTDRIPILTIHHFFHHTLNFFINFVYPSNTLWRIRTLSYAMRSLEKALHFLGRGLRPI